MWHARDARHPLTDAKEAPSKAVHVMGDPEYEARGEVEHLEAFPSMVGSLVPSKSKNTLCQECQSERTRTHTFTHAEHAEHAEQPDRALTSAQPTSSKGSGTVKLREPAVTELGVQNIHSGD